MFSFSIYLSISLSLSLSFYPRKVSGLEQCKVLNKGETHLTVSTCYQWLLYILDAYYYGYDPLQKDYIIIGNRKKKHILPLQKGYFPLLFTICQNLQNSLCTFCAFILHLFVSKKIILQLEYKKHIFSPPPKTIFPLLFTASQNLMNLQRTIYVFIFHLFDIL
jgi:hypothetical protein